MFSSIYSLKGLVESLNLKFYAITERSKLYIIKKSKKLILFKLFSSIISIYSLLNFFSIFYF